jgi:hypothetical protein
MNIASSFEMQKSKHSTKVEKLRKYDVQTELNNFDLGNL